MNVTKLKKSKSFNIKLSSNNVLSSNDNNNKYIGLLRTKKSYVKDTGLASTTTTATTSSSSSSSISTTAGILLTSSSIRRRRRSTALNRKSRSMENVNVHDDVNKMNVIDNNINNKMMERSKTQANLYENFDKVLSEFKTKKSQKCTFDDNIQVRAQQQQQEDDEEERNNSFLHRQVSDNFHTINQTI